MGISGGQILVIEDIQEQVQRVSNLLEEEGFCVQVAHTRSECLSILAETSPSVIVMDLATRLVDGWQMVADVRADELCEQTPIIAVTVYHSANVAEDARRAGFDAYYSKPVEPTTFVRRMRDLIYVSG